MKDKLAFSILETCSETDQGRSTIYKEVKAGRLKIRKIGRRTIVLREDLIEYLKNLPEGPEPPG